MLNEKSTQILKEYLDAQAQDNRVSLNQVIGFMSGLLACSEFFGESELANYIADGDETVYDTLMTESTQRKAMITLLDNVTEAQVEQQKLLAILYPDAASGSAPSAELQEFCRGYIAAYIVNQEVWQSDLQFLVKADEQHAEQNQGQLFVDNFEATLDLLSTFAMWHEALQNHPEPEVLSNGFATLLSALDESLSEIADMALILEDEKLAMIEQDS
ncbi:UPF0149 family protein [Pseudoalteromonas mariniglutinosa]|uniref:UPF0149 family protein n=1 Tax=Pseudoalteromonas mariniglutinosa TaxID=206042 RepID=UPI00384A68F1